MRKKVLISYIWQDRSDERWLFWLKKKLEAKDFEVTFSELPKDLVKSQNQAALIQNLQEVHDIQDKNTYFVAHDPGCLTILTYLEYLAKHDKTEPILLLAGFPKDTGYTQPNTVKRLEGSKAPVVLSGNKDLQLGTLNIKLVVIYGGLIEEKQPLKLAAGEVKRLSPVKKVLEKKESSSNRVVAFLKGKFSK